MVEHRTPGPRRGGLPRDAVPDAQIGGRSTTARALATTDRPSPSRSRSPTSTRTVTLASNVTVGPFSRLRPGSVLDEGVRVGTHAEIKNSHIGAGAAIAHFSAVLDSDVGANANIGAGTVTANYDGQQKHRTEIGNGAQIGSDTILVAPVTVGHDAYTGAGSVITQDVPAGSLAIERGEQKNIPGWTARRRAPRNTEVGKP